MKPKNSPDHSSIVAAVQGAEQRPGQFGTKTFGEFTAFVNGVLVTFGEKAFQGFYDFFNSRHVATGFTPSGYINWYSEMNGQLTDGEKIAWLSREFRAFLENLK